MESRSRPAAGSRPTTENSPSPPAGRPVRDGTPQPGVLLLKLLQPLQPIPAHAAVLPAPPAERLLRHADAHGFGNAHAWPVQHFDLPRASLASQPDPRPPICGAKPPRLADRFTGGTPVPSFCPVHSQAFGGDRVEPGLTPIPKPDLSERQSRKRPAANAIRGADIAAARSEKAAPVHSWPVWRMTFLLRSTPDDRRGTRLSEPPSRKTGHSSSLPKTMARATTATRTLKAMVPIHIVRALEVCFPSSGGQEATVNGALPLPGPAAESAEHTIRSTFRRGPPPPDRLRW